MSEKMTPHQLEAKVQEMRKEREAQDAMMREKYKNSTSGPRNLLNFFDTSVKNSNPETKMTGYEMLEKVEQMKRERETQDVEQMKREYKAQDAAMWGKYKNSTSGPRNLLNFFDTSVKNSNPKTKMTKREILEKVEQMKRERETQDVEQMKRECEAQDAATWGKVNYSINRPRNLLSFFDPYSYYSNHETKMTEYEMLEKVEQMKREREAQDAEMRAKHGLGK